MAVNSTDEMKIMDVKTIKMSKFDKIAKNHQSPTILTPGYRETKELMTIADEVKTIAEVNNTTNEDEIIDPELLCDQRLEIPGDNGGQSYENNMIATNTPLIPPNNYSISDNLPLPNLEVQGIGPTSPYLIELFRKGIDIHNEADRKCLKQRMECSNNELERSSIEAYIRVSSFR